MYERNNNLIGPASVGFSHYIFFFNKYNKYFKNLEPGYSMHTRYAHQHHPQFPHEVSSPVDNPH